MKKKDKNIDKKQIIINQCICKKCPTWIECNEDGRFCQNTIGKSKCIIEENGCICGNCPVYEKMNLDTVIVHYEKGAPDYDEIYKAINLETAKLIHKGFKFVNREPDMGLPGLRKANMSYRPHHMVEVYHIARKKILL